MFIGLFIVSYVCLLVCLLFRMFVYWFVYCFVCLFIGLFIVSYVCLLVCLLFRMFVYRFIVCVCLVYKVSAQVQVQFPSVVHLFLFLYLSGFPAGFLAFHWFCASHLHWLLHSLSFNRPTAS